MKLKEERQHDIEYKQTKDKVIASLTLQKASAASRLAEKIMGLDEQKKMLEKELASLKSDAKQYAESLFNLEDAVLTRAVETNSFIISISKETTRALHDKEIFFKKLEEIYPNLIQQIKEIYNATLKISTSSPSVKVSSLKENNVIQKIKQYISSLYNKIKQNLFSYDKKLNELKDLFFNEKESDNTISLKEQIEKIIKEQIKFIDIYKENKIEEQENLIKESRQECVNYKDLFNMKEGENKEMKIKTEDMKKIIKEEIEKFLIEEGEQIEGEDPALELMTPEQKAEYLKWSKKEPVSKEKNFLNDKELKEEQQPIIDKEKEYDRLRFSILKGLKDLEHLLKYDFDKMALTKRDKAIMKSDDPIPGEEDELVEQKKEELPDKKKQ